MTIEVFRPILVKRLSYNLNHTKVYEVVVFLMSLYGSTIQDPYHLIFLLYIYTQNSMYLLCAYHNKSDTAIK